MESSTKDKVLKVVNRISGGKVKNINPEGNLKTELALDSIQIVELVASLEKEFNVELPMKIMTVRTGKEFMELLDDCIKK